MSLDPELRAAANYLLDHAHGIRATIVMAEHVKSVEALEQLSNEAEGILAGKRKELGTVEGEADKARQRLSKAEEKAKAAEAKADDIIASAKGEADTIIERAEAKAAGIVSRGESEAAAAQSKSTGVLDGIRAEIATAQAERDRLDGEITERSVAVADLEKRAGKAQKFLSDLAGKA